MDEKDNVLKEVDDALSEEGVVKHVVVDNLTDIPQPLVPRDIEFPTNQDVTLTNKEVPVRVVNPPKDAPQLKEIKVTNLSEIKIPPPAKPQSEVSIKEPKWYKPLDLTGVSGLLKRLLEVVVRLEVPTDDPAKPIAVRLSDGESFYKALEYVLQNSGGSGGSALTWMDSSQSPTRATTVKVNGLQYAAVVNPDGTNVTDYVYKTLYDFDSLGTYIYIGTAVPGTSTASAAWRIQKVVFDANGNPTGRLNASGTSLYDKIWNNHTSYTYTA